MHFTFSEVPLYWIISASGTTNALGRAHGISENGLEFGQIIWSVPVSLAGETFYYVCEFYAHMRGNASYSRQMCLLANENLFLPPARVLDRELSLFFNSFVHFFLNSIPRNYQDRGAHDRLWRRGERWSRRLEDRWRGRSRSDGSCRVSNYFQRFFFGPSILDNILARRASASGSFFLLVSILSNLF